MKTYQKYSFCYEFQIYNTFDRFIKSFDLKNLKEIPFFSITLYPLTLVFNSMSIFLVKMLLGSVLSICSETLSSFCSISKLSCYKYGFV